MAVRKPFTKKYAILENGEKLVIDSREKLETVDEKFIVTKKVFDEAIEPQSEPEEKLELDGGEVVKVRSLKEGEVFDVRYDYYEKYRGQLEIVTDE